MTAVKVNYFSNNLVQTFMVYVHLVLQLYLPIIFLKCHFLYFSVPEMFLT